MLLLAYNTPTEEAIGSPQADLTPPTVVSTNPANLSTNVAITINPSVTFSEFMATTTYGNSIFLVDPLGNKVALDSWNLGLVSCSLDPSGTLNESTTYTFIVKGDVTDIAGNTLDGNNNSVAEGSPTDDFNITFTTKTTSQTTTIEPTNTSNGLSFLIAFIAILGISPLRKMKKSK